MIAIKKYFHMLIKILKHNIKKDDNDADVTDRVDIQ